MTAGLTQRRIARMRSRLRKNGMVLESCRIVEDQEGDQNYLQGSVSVLKNFTVRFSGPRSAKALDQVIDYSTDLMREHTK